MDQPYRDRFRALIIECCAELFGSCGIGVACLADDAMNPDAEAALAALIGFAGPRARGNLLICAPLALLERSHPLAPQPPDEPAWDLADWMGELANQLLGRVKNRLVSYGLFVSMSTPTCLRGRRLHSRPSSRGLSEQLLFQTELGAKLYVHFNAVLDRTFVFPERPLEHVRCRREGELELF